MTKPRTSTTREIGGLIGRWPDRSALLRDWNRWLTEEGSDAVMQYYPTTVATLPARLSEMFHFDRRFYLVGEDLAREAERLLDVLDEEVPDGRTMLILNVGGILRGSLLADETDMRNMIVSVMRNETC